MSSADAAPAPPGSWGKLRKRLWLAGLGVGLFLLTLLIGTAASSQSGMGWRNLGHDFIAFYTAGTFAREGRVRELHDFEVVRRFQHDLIARENLAGGKGFLPWLNPPFYAWLFAPFSMLPFMTALRAWMLVNLLAFAGAMALLARMLPGDWRQRGLVVLLSVCSMPFLMALSHGQNTFISLLLLAAVVTAWRGGRGFAAGALAGLLFYKPQLAAGIALALVITLGWRALAGLAATGAALRVVTLLTMPGALTDFFALLPQNVHAMQAQRRFLWERHVTFNAFWRMLIQGDAIGETTLVVRALTLLSAGTLGAALTWTFVRARGRMVESRDRLIAATIVTMPLLMPYYFDYDLMLLAVAAVLFAAEACGKGFIASAREQWLAGLWVALGAWLFVNAVVTGATRVNLAVGLLAAVSGLFIARAWRSCGREAESVEASSTVQHLRVRSAA